MKNNFVYKKKKNLILMIVFIMFFSMIGSYFVITNLISHDCNHENCRFCLIIEKSREFISDFKETLPVLILLNAIVLIKLMYVLLDSYKVYILNSLFKHKILLII